MQGKGREGKTKANKERNQEAGLREKVEEVEEKSGEEANMETEKKETAKNKDAEKMSQRFALNLYSTD